MRRWSEQVFKEQAFKERVLGRQRQRHQEPSGAGREGSMSVVVS